MDELTRLCAQLRKKLEPYRVGSVKARTRLNRKHGERLSQLAWLMYTLLGVHVAEKSTSPSVRLARGERKDELARLCLQLYEKLDPYRDADEATRTALVDQHGQILADLALLLGILAEPDPEQPEKKLYYGYYWAGPLTEVIFDFVAKQSQAKRSAPY